MSLAGVLALLGVSQSIVVKADVNNDNNNPQADTGVTTQAGIKEQLYDNSEPELQDKTNLNPAPETKQVQTADQPSVDQDSNDASEQSSGTVANVQWNFKNKSLYVSAGDLNEISSDSNPWGTSNDYLKQNATSITIGDDGTGKTGKVVAGKSATGLFEGFKNVTAINGLSNLDVSNTDDLSNLFSDCTNLTSLDLSAMDIKKTASIDNMLGNDTNIDTLVLSPSTKLTNSGLNVGQHNETNGYMWSVKGLTPKNTSDLIALYNGASTITDTTTWHNYAPFTISVIGEDTNGKVLGSTNFYSPIDSEGKLKPDSSEFYKGLTNINSNGKVILDESGNQLVSRLYSSRITPDIWDAEKDSQGRLFLTLKYFGATSDVNKFFSRFTSNAMTTEDLSGLTYTYYLVYPAKENANSSSGSSSTNREIEGIEERVSTYAEKPEVQLYDDNGSILTDRKLSPNSDWYTDESMQLNKDKYYRVATNQWAKANDVYLYYPSASKVRVNAGTTATLVTDEGETVTDRALQPLSNWYTDKYIYINDVKYYRVATNEFVSANQVAEY
ncbi:hypothetical protein FD31_GL000392 [Companilactobacillus nantensis DSM 16982]|uniref:S-layer protein C-terminal domain-containing protein n=1 Tax=Companilactobacillus nantensis DSM 16982 TaxID=1423774 RepID=A0A0R1WMX8_9LACO|nr:hypothetical protein FD31_GL000392 [Companilactobacillus nantensis DSM 16982]